MGERAHLSIGEVLSLVQEDFPDVTISKIRFLESQGLLDPERTPSGYRKFYDHDIERLEWILVQQRDHFLPLKVIRERLAEWDATGTPPDGALQTPPASELPGGAGGDHDQHAERDGRHAAADLAASSAVEVLARTEPATTPETPPPPVADVAMEAPPRAEAPNQPDASSGLLAGPASDSLTAEELAERAGIPVAAVRELENFSMIESRRIGSESYFDPEAVVVADACRRFLDQGVEVRHLRMYKIAAEREAGVFEQLVMPLLKQRNPEARARAVEMVTELGRAGEELHAALLRSVLSDTLP